MITLQEEGLGASHLFSVIHIYANFACRQSSREVFFQTHRIWVEREVNNNSVLSWPKQYVGEILDLSERDVVFRDPFFNAVPKAKSEGPK